MSRWMARRRTRLRRRFGRPSAISLLEPWVGVVVVAARLPVARVILGGEADAGQPLGALPEVTIGDERADRGAVAALERLAVVAVGDEDVRLHRLFEVDVRGVAGGALEDDEA